MTKLAWGDFNFMPKLTGTNQLLIRELRRMRDTAAFHSLATFYTEPRLTTQQRTTIENHIQEHFHNWWDSWMAPKIDEIEKKICR